MGLYPVQRQTLPCPGKPFPDLFPRRIWIAHQKPFGRHDEPRRTEAALHARIRHERPLQRMKPFRRADALDGFDFRIRLDLFHLFDAGARDLPVEQQRTSAAVPGSAPDFRPGEPKTPHHVGKGVLLRLTKDFPIYPIDVQDDSLNGHGSSSVKGLDIFQTRRIAFSPGSWKERQSAFAAPQAARLSSSGRRYLPTKSVMGGQSPEHITSMRVDVSDRRACSRAGNSSSACSTRMP